MGEASWRWERVQWPTGSWISLGQVLSTSVDEQDFEGIPSLQQLQFCLLCLCGVLRNPWGALAERGGRCSFSGRAWESPY